MYEEHSARLWPPVFRRTIQEHMNALLIAIYLVSRPVLAGPIEDCVDGADVWFEALQRDGCPSLERYHSAAIDGCRTTPEDGWTRTQKTARKAIFKDCKPGKKGFPGAQDTLPDGSTSSRCSELMQLVQGVETGLPTQTKWGVDRMVAATSAALFACHAPNDIDLCLLPSTIQTPSGHIEQRRDACARLKNPPLDTYMRKLAWDSGLMRVEPQQQVEQLNALLVAQEEARLLHKKEEERFQTEREEEVVRARDLSDRCMKLPGDMTTANETVIAADACQELEALWRGEDTIRKELEASGALAARYAEQLRGKVLNADSLNAADPKRVASRPTILEERRIALVDSEFKQLIESSPSEAEKLLDTYRDLMGPEWTAEAQDQLLATGN